MFYKKGWNCKKNERLSIKNLAIENNIGNIKKKDSKQEKRLIEALFSLGYKKGEAKEIIEKIEIKEDLSDEEYLKIILREISSKN